MSMFSSEEKKRVLRYVVVHALDENSAENELRWQELGQLMGRNSEEIRTAYNQWIMDDVPMNELKSIKQETPNSESEAINVLENCDMLEVMQTENVLINNEDELQYLSVNGELININDLEYVLNDPANIQYNDNQGVVIGKRSLDLNDFDTELLKSFESKSQVELELKKEEHERKMKIYKQQLEQGVELHKEKMKILKAKLRAIEQQVYHIDHIICNKHLKRKFKSGPI